MQSYCKLYQLFLLQVERQEFVHFSFVGVEMWELLLDKVSHLKVLKKVAIGEAVFL